MPMIRKVEKKSERVTARRVVIEGELYFSLSVTDWHVLFPSKKGVQSEKREDIISF